MEMLTPDVKQAAQAKFTEKLTSDVDILHFTQEPSRLVLPDHLKGIECVFCKETKQLMTEIAALSERLNLQIFDFTSDKDKAESHGIDKIPATVLVGQEDYGVRFFGIPSGYEFPSFLEALIDVSRGATSLAEKTVQALQDLNKDVHIQVFVTPTCPYCTLAVRLAHQFAVASPRITADMVESTEFPHLVQRYGVAGVPKTVFNDEDFLEGALPEEAFLEAVLKAGEALS